MYSVYAAEAGGYELQVEKMVVFSSACTRPSAYLADASSRRTDPSGNGTRLDE